MKKRIKLWICRTVAILAMLGSVASLAFAVPAEALLSVGRRAAMLAAGLRRPNDGARLLTASLKPTLLSSESQSELTVLGEAVRETVPTAVTSATVNEPDTAAVTAAVTVKKKAGAGTVLTQQMSAGSNFVEGVAIRNKSGQTVNIATALNHIPKINLKKNSTAPQVLITHTHTTECYLGYDAGFYNPDDPTRTDDPAKNTVAVGERVAAVLRQAGIGVLHDTEIHDHPYTGAYSRSKAAVSRYLKQYPSIAVVLDIHRDAVYRDETTHIKPTAVINGKKAAQVMVIVGMQNTKAVPNPHTAENLSFGVRLQQRLHRDHAGLARPLLLANARYNQQLCNGSVLIEFGSDVNTLEEACYSAELVGQTLVSVLRELGA